MLVGSGVLNGNLSDHGRNARPAIVCRVGIPIPASDLKEKLEAVSTVAATALHFDAIPGENHNGRFLGKELASKDLFHFVIGLRLDQASSEFSLSA